MAERKLEIQAEVTAKGAAEAQRAQTWIEALIAAGQKAERQTESLQAAYERYTRELEENSQAARIAEERYAELVERLRRMNATSDETAAGLSRINRRFQDGQGDAHLLAEELYDIRVNLNRSIDPLEDYESHINQVQRELQRWTSDTREHSRIEDIAGSTRVRQLDSFAKIAGVINRTRFHTTELAQATGLLNRETFEATRQTSLAKDDFESLERTLQTLTASVRHLTDNLEKQDRRTAALEFATDALGAEIQDTGERAYYLNEALFESQQQLDIWKTRAEIARLQAEALGREFNQVEDESEELATDLHRLEQKVDDVADEMRQAGNRADDMADDLDRARTKAEAFGETVGNLVSEALEEAAEAIVEFARDAVQTFFDFDRQTREIFTLIPQASGQMRTQLQQDALAMSTALGRLPQETLPAIYNALSAGIPPENVLADVRIASDAARAGVAELDDTLALGVSILNAQVGGVDNLNEVYDQLFFLVQKGVVTIPQLNGELSKVTSVAGEAGVSLQDIVAAMIVMTRQGDTVTEATELLAIALTQLSTSGTTLASVFEEAAGKSFRQFIAEGGSLAGAMQLLQDHAANTGQALGDILGGGSPFFRDTQAARGVLELTGKHLQDLTRFSHEAESATGAMGTAAAQMGEAAELGTLRYQAALAELKIVGGDYLAQVATPLLENATEFFKLWSGNRQREVHGMVEEFENVNEAGRKLARLFGELNTPLGALTGGFRTVQEEAALLAARTGDFAGGNEALIASLEDVFGGTVTVKQGYVQLNGLALESVARLQELNQEHRQQEALLAGSSQAITHFDQNLLKYNVTQEESNKVIRTNNELLLKNSDIVHATTNVYDGLTTAEERLAFAAAVARDTHQEASLAYELTAAQVEAVTVAHEASTAAAERNTQAYANYVLQSIDAATNTTNWKDELFRAGLQAGITQEQILLLATASGEYSQAQIEAMLKTAALRTAVEQLGAAMAAGEITTKQALEALEDLEKQLDQEYTATLKYEDISKAKDEAQALKDRLHDIRGTHEVNVHTTYTESGTPPNIPDGQVGTPLAAGGPFRAGELLLVGDGPGGQVLPTSELVAFNRPGTVFPGDLTNQILAMLHGGSGRGDQYIINTQDNTLTVLNQLQARRRRELISQGM